MRPTEGCGCLCGRCPSLLKRLPPRPPPSLVLLLLLDVLPLLLEVLPLLRLVAGLSCRLLSRATFG